MAWDVQDVTSSFPHPNWSTPGRFLYTLGALLVADRVVHHYAGSAPSATVLDTPHGESPLPAPSLLRLFHMRHAVGCGAVDRLIAYRIDSKSSAVQLERRLC